MAEAGELQSGVASLIPPDPSLSPGSLEPKTFQVQEQVTRKALGNARLVGTPGTPATGAWGMLRGRAGGAGVGCSGAQEPGGAAASPLPGA